MHCGDRDLIAFADGEISWLHRRRIERHLRVCWHCRAQLRATEESIAALARDIEQNPFPGPHRLAGFRRRLQAGIAGQEHLLSICREPSRPRWPRALAWLALPLAAAIGWLSIPHTPPADPVRAADVVARATRAEQALYSRPVEQRLSVEVVEIQPRPKRSRTVLTVVSDLKRQRFTSRWTGPDGSVKHAVWRDGHNGQFVYRPSDSATPVRLASATSDVLPLESLADYGLDTSQIERAFGRWIEQRAARPVSFSSDLQAWSVENGVEIDAERVSPPDAAPVLRVTARRTGRRIVADLRMEFDAVTYRPRLQTIRFETPGRAIEFRVEAAAFRTLEPAEVADGWFRPDGVAPPVIAAVHPAAEPVIPEPVSVPAPALASHTDIRAIEAHYVLHQAGACLGEPVLIEAVGSMVRVRNRGNRGDRWLEGMTSSAQMPDVLAVFSSLRDSHSALPEGIERGGVGYALSGAIRHAQALRRLAIDWPSRRTAGLPVTSWRLLESMIREHADGVGREVDRLGLSQDIESAAVDASLDWRSAGVSVFDTLLRTEELLRDEPMAKVAPLIQDAAAMLESIRESFAGELHAAYQRASADR